MPLRARAFFGRSLTTTVVEHLCRAGSRRHKRCSVTRRRDACVLFTGHSTLNCIPKDSGVPDFNGTSGLI